MTLDEMITTLTSWRDLKKIGDAKVSVLEHDRGTWSRVEQVTFGADGSVYIEPEKPLSATGSQRLDAVRSRVEARLSGVDLAADHGSSSAPIAIPELDAVLEIIDEEIER